MARSMTGFARVSRTIGNFDVVVSLKSVNHRGLDLQFHISSDLDPYENAMRAAIKQNAVRGHIDVRVSVTRGLADSSLQLDPGRLAAYIAAYRAAAQQFDITGEPDLNAALRVPGVLSESSGTEFPADFEAGLIGALGEALTILNRVRAREGSELIAVMKEHNGAIALAAIKMEGLRNVALEAFHGRLRERLGDLLNGAPVDPQRLAQEAAMLADRSDIGEEIARLKIHARQLDETLETGGEVGKKLDFLLQEMNRETNTILSKTSGIGETGLGITELALACKSHVEKIREQSLNLE
jgi:uncharacterized protein (TIGR00255 family)